MAKNTPYFWAAALAVAAFFVNRKPEAALELEPVDPYALAAALSRADSIIQEAISTGTYLDAAQTLTSAVGESILQHPEYVEKLNFFASAVSNSVFDYAVVKSILSLYTTQAPFALVGISNLETKVANLS